MRKKKDHVRTSSHLRKEIKHYLLIIAALKMLIIAAFIPGCTKDNGGGPLLSDQFAIANIQEVYPVNEAKSVAVNSAIGATFKSGTESSKVTSASLSLKTGGVPVPGNVRVAGNSVFFSYGNKLQAMTEYSATLTTTRKNSSGSEESCDVSWNFKTGKDREDKTLTVLSVSPVNKATDVPVTTMVTANLNKEVKSWMKSLISINVKAGTTDVAGSVSFDGKKVTFDPSADLLAGTTYACTFVYLSNVSGNDDGDDEGDDDNEGDDKAGNYTWSFTTTGSVTGTPGPGTDVTAPVVNSVAPGNNAAAVTTSSALSATFSEPMNPATITASTFLLKQGTTAVAGSVTYSGTTAVLTPASLLTGGTTYTATITTGAKDLAGNPIAANYTWSFTTAAATQGDVTAPTVVSTVPASNAGSVAVTSKVTATFSEAMNSSTISAATFTLKQGTTAIAGSVTYSGTLATFTPSASLTAGTVYTATITTGAKDAAGNALAANYTWSFTTAAAAPQGDVTAPTVSSTSPGSNAASVAVTAKVTATFSETMNSSTISASTFTLKQGTTAIAGTVTYSGTTATFTPSASLTAGTVYTATITTGAKDAAGNALAANYTWNFTTVAAPAGLSFANDVVPVLTKCNTCHTHPWTTSSNASTFYNNLVNGGYVNPTNYTASKIYTKLSGGHAVPFVPQTDVDKIINWMKQGSLNN